MACHFYPLHPIYADAERGIPRSPLGLLRDIACVDRLRKLGGAGSRVTTDTSAASVFEDLYSKKSKSTEQTGVEVAPSKRGETT